MKFIIGQLFWRILFKLSDLCLAASQLSDAVILCLSKAPNGPKKGLNDQS